MRKLLLLACMLSAAACAPDLQSQPDKKTNETADTLACDSSAKATCDDNTLEYCDARTGKEEKVDCTATNGKICGSDAQFGASCQAAGTKVTDTPCGSVTAEGICQGDTKVFCDKKSSTQKKINCAANGGKCASVKGGATCQAVDAKTPTDNDACGSVGPKGECGLFGWSSSYCSKDKLVSTWCSGDTECFLPGQTGSCDTSHAACCSPADSPAEPTPETCTTNYRRCENNKVMKCVVGEVEEEDDCSSNWVDDICREAGDFGSCDASGAACCAEGDTEPEPEEGECASGEAQSYCDGNVAVKMCDSASEGTVREDCSNNSWFNVCKGDAIYSDEYWDGSSSAECGW